MPLHCKRNRSPRFPQKAPIRKPELKTAGLHGLLRLIAGVLGRAGEEGKLRRLELAKQKQYTFTPASNLRLPGNLNNSGPTYPRVLKLGSTIQELEEQDRGNAYNYGAGQQGTGSKHENTSI